MIRRVVPWIVLAIPGFIVTFVLDLDPLSGILLCLVFGVAAGVWAHIFDGGVPW